MEKRHPLASFSGVNKPRQMEVLPPPDGDEIITIRPGLGHNFRWLGWPVLLNVLNHFSEFLYLFFERNGRLGKIDLGALRGRRIRFAVEFLQDEVELLA